MSSVHTTSPPVWGYLISGLVAAVVSGVFVVLGVYLTQRREDARERAMMEREDQREGAATSRGRQTL